MKSYTHRTLLTSIILTFLVTIHATPTPSSICEPVRTCLAQLANKTTCSVLPPIPGTRLPPVPSAGFTLSEHRRGVWTYYDGVYHTLMLSSGSHFVFVDFPDSGGSNKPDGSGTRVTDAAEIIIGDIMPSRIDMVYSHGHLDHIGASKRFYNYFRGKFPHVSMHIYGTHDARKRIEVSVTDRSLVPDVIIESGGRVIGLDGSLSLQLKVIGGHSDFDVVSYIPRADGEPSLAHLADMIYPGWAPFQNFGVTTDLREYVEAHKALLELDNIDVLSGGHVILGDRSDIVKSLEYVEDVIDEARESTKMETAQVLIEAGFGAYVDETANEFGNIWYLLVDVVLGGRADRCSRRIIEKWGCKLSGVDINARSHCFTALVFLLSEE